MYWLLLYLFNTPRPVQPTEDTVYVVVKFHMFWVDGDGMKAWQQGQEAEGSHFQNFKSYS